MRIYTFDTTLRDGTQGEAVSLSVDDKLLIARKLDELRIDYIEGGWPGSNPKDKEFFARAHMRESTLAKHTVMDAVTVAAAGYRGMMRGDRIVVPGVANRAVSVLVRAAPRRLLTRVVARLNRGRGAPTAG